jgi:hypothetical protein
LTSKFPTHCRLSYGHLIGQKNGFSGKLPKIIYNHSTVLYPVVAPNLTRERKHEARSSDSIMHAKEVQSIEMYKLQRDWLPITLTADAVNLLAVVCHRAPVE